MATIHTLTTLPAVWDDPILTRAQAESLLTQPHHLLLAIMEESTPNTQHQTPEHHDVGYLFLRLMPQTPADILTLYIPPAHRRQGYARALMESALEAAKSAACTGLTLEVEASNTAAINLYRVCGLQQVAVRANYYVDPVSNLKADALVLAVSLA